MGGRGSCGEGSGPHKHFPLDAHLPGPSEAWSLLPGATWAAVLESVLWFLFPVTRPWDPQKLIVSSLLQATRLVMGPLIPFAVITICFSVLLLSEKS